MKIGSAYLRAAYFLMSVLSAAAGNGQVLNAAASGF
jgi:hypothetical protein